MKKKWSPQQKAVFENVANGTGHTVVLARAGSGKTTTIVEAFNHVPEGASVLMIAFNKSIATELQSRAPAGVEVSTLHSFGLKAIMRQGPARIDNDKMDRILVDGLGDEPETRDLRRSIAKCASLAKGSLATTPEEIDAIIDQHQIVPPESSEDRPQFARYVLRALEEAKADRKTIDFDDMIWLPVVLKMQVRKFDRVFIDETQDLNAAQIQLALRACKSTGRICAVGDDRQAIYAFRGADTNAVPNVIRELKATILPLSVTYRCASAIVDIARTVVPDFEAAPNANAGEVLSSTVAAMIASASGGDFVLSRTNAPLISHCMAFLREGKRATIQGRDIGAKLTGMIRRSKATTIVALLEYVNTWRQEEIARLTAVKRDTQSVDDTAECVIALTEGASSVSDVIARIESLFSEGDDTTRIVLSSTHKAKGLERDRVWLLASTYRRGTKGRKSRPMSATQVREEENLFYVAVTRARKTLHMVQDAK